jgi:hypothetical protein
VNWDALGAAGEFISGMIVVATVIYLSRQIRETNKRAKAEAERDVMAIWNDRIIDNLLRDRNLRSVIRRGFDSFESLIPDEQLEFQLFIAHVMNHLEMVLRMERDGLLATDMAGFWRGLALSILATTGGRECWKISGGVYQPLSTDHVNKSLSDGSEIVPV